MARKLISKDAVHLGNQTDFNPPTEKPRANVWSRRRAARSAASFAALLEAAPFVRVRETLCRQTSGSMPCCAAVHQLNPNLLFEMLGLPTEGWLEKCGAFAQRRRYNCPRASHGDDSSVDAEFHHCSHVSQAWAQLT